MSKDERSDQKAFEKLLAWLDPSRDKAAEKYQRIQFRLIRIFAAKGCWEAEDLADRTFNRVMLKIDWLIANYVGDPALFFYAVAKKIYLERLKMQPPIDTRWVEPENADIERQCACLEQCLRQVTSREEADLILQYHEKEKQERISKRKELAAKLGISVNALRIRVFHIHSRLRLCIEECLRQLPEM